MSLKNTPENYGSVSRSLHWLSAFLVILALTCGLTLDLLKFRLIDLHKSVGITILILTFARIFWHFYSKKPPLAATLEKWEKMVAHGLHGMLYFCMIAMPFSGWIVTSAKGYPVKFFGLMTLPPLVEKNKGLAEVFGEVHEILGYTLIVVIILHVAAALKHHFIDRDTTLRRMTPFLKEK